MSRIEAKPEKLRKGQRNEIRMISRAAEVLRVLAAGSRRMSLGQIAQGTGLARSTVQRIVGALEVEGMVITTAGESGVCLGPELVRLGSAVQANLRSIIRPFLQELNVQTKDTIDLTLLMDGIPIVVDQVSSTTALRVVSFIGRPLPLHATASGKAHISAMNKASAGKLLETKLEPFTAHTITASATLLRIADTLGKNDFFYDREEFDEEVCAIALPLQTPGPDNYAIAVSMPRKRFENRLPLLRTALRQAQRGVESALGIT